MAGSYLDCFHFRMKPIPWPDSFVGLEKQPSHIFLDLDETFFGGRWYHLITKMDWRQASTNVNDLSPKAPSDALIDPDKRQRYKAKTPDSRRRATYSSFVGDSLYYLYIFTLCIFVVSHRSVSKQVCWPLIKSWQGFMAGTLSVQFFKFFWGQRIRCRRIENPKLSRKLLN